MCVREKGKGAVGQREQVPLSARREAAALSPVLHICTLLGLDEARWLPELVTLARVTFLKEDGMVGGAYFQLFYTTKVNKF